MEEKKAEQLLEAFHKAVDVSINNTIRSTNFEEFLGESERAGVERVFIACVSKAESQMSESFQNINKEKIIQYDTVRQNNASSTSSGKMNPEEMVAKQVQDTTNVVNAIKKKEVDELKHAIRTMELDIRKLKDNSGRLRTQLFNEVEALGDENVKIQHAVGPARSTAGPTRGAYI